jgi:ubiquinone/menaquinone biosynthesis C-methylase UbiE
MEEKMTAKNLDFVYKVSFACIKMMHDGMLLKLLVKPDKVLAALGLKNGDTVFEPGCGPGFFTIGAAQVVGDKGHVYAFDVNPYAIRYLQKKLDTVDMDNVTSALCNAAESNLPEQSIDFAFITGIPHAVGGFDKMMKEISRTLKTGGIFAYRGKRRPENKFSTQELESWRLMSIPEKKSNGFKVFIKE